MLTIARTLGLFVCLSSTLVAQETVWSLSNSPARALELIQAERGKTKLTAFKASPALTKAAQAHAANMAKQEMFAHELDNAGPADRALAHGYDSRYIGETIAWQSALDPAQVVDSWWNSPPHKKILLGEYRDAGIGVAQLPGGNVYWVVVVGNPE